MLLENAPTLHMRFLLVVIDHIQNLLKNVVVRVGNWWYNFTITNALIPFPFPLSRSFRRNPVFKLMARSRC